MALDLSPTWLLLFLQRATINSHHNIQLSAVNTWPSVSVLRIRTPKLRFMLHTHNALAGDLHASVKLTALASSAWNPSSPQCLPISQLLRLEKRALVPKPCVSSGRVLSTFPTLSTDPVAKISRLPIRRPLGQREIFAVKSEDSDAAESYAPRATSRRQSRHFSHQASGLCAKLPRLNPLREVPPPPAQPSSANPRSRKPQSGQSILRNTASNVDAFQGLESPDVERERQEKKVQEEREKRLKLLREEELRKIRDEQARKDAAAEAEKQRLEAKRRHEQQLGREELLRQQEIAQKEREYHNRVVEPIRLWENSLRHLSDQLPSSEASLRVYLSTVRELRRREWRRRYLLDIELPIEFLERESERLEVLLEAFPAIIAITMVQSTSKKALWQWLWAQTDMLSMQLDALQQEVNQYEQNIRAFQRALLAVAKDSFDELELSKHTAQGLHYRSKALANKYSAALSRVLECLDDASLSRIKSELINRGKWDSVGPGSPVPAALEIIPYVYLPEMVSAALATPKSESGSMKMDGNLFRGARSQRTLNAFAALYFIRADLDEDAREINLLLHVWRQYDVVSNFLSHVPYVITHRVYFDKLEVPMRILGHLALFWLQDLRILCRLNFAQMGNVTQRLRRMTTLALRVSTLVASANGELHDAFKYGLSPLMLSPMSVVEQSQLAIYRPFLSAKDGFRDIGIAARQVLSERKRPSPGFRATVQAIEEIPLDMAPILYNSIIGSGVYDLYYGTTYRPRRWRGSVSTTTVTPKLLPCGPSFLPPTTGVESVSALSLYPETRTVTIKYVQSMRETFFAVQSQKSSKVLALDAIVIEYVNQFNVSTSHIEYLLMASENAVLIFRVGYQGMRGDPLPNLRNILEDPTVLKVGVNLPFIRQTLSQEYNWNLGGCVNLAGNTNAIISRGDHVGSSHELLAQLASKVLGTALPEPPSIQALLTDGAEGPLELFRYLASRVYVALQLYQTMSSRTLMGGRDDLMQSERDLSTSSLPAASLSSLAPNIQLGPVHVDSLWGITRQYTGKRAGRPSEITREAYLQLLSGKLAESVLHKHSRGAAQKQLRRDRMRLLKPLQAYFLVTTFDEPLDAVQKMLGIEKPYATVVSTAKLYHLPLHKDHRASLRRDSIASGKEAPDRKIELKADASELAEQKTNPARGDVGTVDNADNGRTREREVEQRRQHKAARMREQKKKELKVLSSIGGSQEASRVLYSSASATSSNDLAPPTTRFVPFRSRAVRKKESLVRSEAIDSPTKRESGPA